MEKILNSIGKAAFKRHWIVVSVWVVILATLGLLAVSKYEPLSNTVSIPGTNAQQTLEKFSDMFADAGEGNARLVFSAKQGTVADFKDQIEQASDDLGAISGVNQVISPFENPLAISADQKIAYLQIQLEHGVGEISEETSSKIDAVAANSRTKLLQVELNGDTINKVPEDIIGIGEVFGVILALMVLVITLGALVAAGLPIIIAVVTVGIGGAGLFALSSVVDITATTPVLAIMIGLAVGIDYSLFIVNKYRHLLLEGYAYRDAAIKSIETAGKAVVFAALTVIIALAALVVVDIPFMTSMGLAGAGTVAVAAISAVTLLPALFAITKTRIFGGKTRKRIAQAQKRGPQDEVKIKKQTFWYRIGNGIAEHPVISLLVAVIFITSIALPARSLDLGLPTDEFAAKNSTEHKAYQLLTKGFGAGFSGPLIVVTEGLPEVTDQNRQEVRQKIMAEYQNELDTQIKAQEERFAQQAAAATTPADFMQLQEDIAIAEQEGQRQQKIALETLEQQIKQYSEFYQIVKVSDRLAALDGVAQSIPMAVTDDGKQGAIQVVSSSSPSSQETHDLVETIRNLNTQEELGHNMTVGVTGSTALQMDINDKLTSALPIYLAVVVGLSLILLIIAFQSILVPIKATLGFLLSVFAMFGAIVAIFQWGWLGIAEAPGPIVSFIPIISIGVLFGLAMDYQFFMASGIHEEYVRTNNPKKAVANGYSLGGKVVFAAATIMVLIFASFITNGDSTIQAIGFGLAVGIFVDAFIVRMVIIPAGMKLLGKSAWWIPAWLRKILPKATID